MTKPIVRIAEDEYARLENLSRSSMTAGAVLLAHELERSRIVPRAQVAAEGPFARLGSMVEYRDVLGGAVRRVQLSAPNAADIDEGRLSVLSPVGAALIGLSAGDTFSWTGDDGRFRVVVVEAVTPNRIEVIEQETA